MEEYCFTGGKRMRCEEAVKIIEAGSGTHFDPDVVKAFVEISDKFAAIATQFGEDE